MKNERYFYCPECKMLEPKLNIEWIAGKPFCKSCGTIIKIIDGTFDDVKKIMKC